jgi:hypothetical protein
MDPIQWHSMWIDSLPFNSLLSIESPESYFYNVSTLNRKPIFLYTLQTNDAIFIDEFEFASAEFVLMIFTYEKKHK